MKILVTAGPTREAIDPVRYITNRSSGKMGYALAAAAVEMGFEVKLISGPVELATPEGLDEYVRVESAAEMAEAVKSRAAVCDCVIMTAAVADYRPKQAAGHKIKKEPGDRVIELERTEDILASLGERKHPGQILIGFAAETQNLEHYALDKLKRKNLDWIAANNVAEAGCGFQSETNAVTLYGRNGQIVSLPKTAKSKLARQLLHTVFK